MNKLASTIGPGSFPTAHPYEGSSVTAPSYQPAGGGETVRIRRYPNRRLYDTSRSRHLTHDGVIALIRDGKTVQVTDSRSGADITNIVLLQIMVERDPTKVQALPSMLIHRAMRSEEGALKLLAEQALAAWRSAPVVADSQVRAQGLGVSSASTPRPNGVALVPQRIAPAPTVSPSGDANGLNGRPKAKAKRFEG